LAHAVGNLNLKLNEWKIDFGCFCTYKYMNSGPGSIGGLFLHEMHHETNFKRFEGWWGNKRENRFSLKTYFDGQKGAGVYQLSNPSIFSLIPLLSSLEIFNSTSMKELRNKSEVLTSYLEYLMEKNLKEDCFCLTPKNPTLRGCQLSFKFPKHNIHQLCSKLEEKNIEVDKREPDVMRVSPVPLYNSFLEVFQFVQVLKQVV
jgi:kynureninase